MTANLSKIIISPDAPCIISLMRLIETQSKTTLGDWALTYAEKNVLPIYEKSFADDRPRTALLAARDWFAGRIKLPECKLRNLAGVAAKEATNNPAAQAAASSCANAALIPHTPRHTIGFALYCITAIVYDSIGTVETAEIYEQLTQVESAKMSDSLRAIAIQDEPNPVEINWDTFVGEGTLFWRQSRKIDLI
jgi:hypothetical protein